MTGRTFSRSLAWTALLEYQKSQADPDEILDALAHPGIPEKDRALAWEIVKGSIKLLRKLDYIAQSYMKAPMASQKPGVVAALRIGLYQLTEMSSIPQFAAVDETVSLLSATKMKRDAGFVNAILRAYIRMPEKVRFPDRDAEPMKFLATFYSYPDWLVKRWLDRYGLDESEKMLNAFNQRPPVCFRAIACKNPNSRIVDTFRSSGIEIRPGRYFPEYAIADKAFEIVHSELFKQGFLIAQDESQGLPILLLDPPLGASVLDLCSAPGGKTMALADIVGSAGRVISVDKEAKRLDYVKENAERIGLGNIDFICRDVLQFAPQEKFSYILLDVPCSALGTMRQNADIRWTKSERDIKASARLQAKLLEKTAEFVNNGGRIVYSTCTTEPDEIEDVVMEFLKNDGQFTLLRSKSDLAAQFETADGFYRSWPHKHGVGGGGFAILTKKG